MIKTFLQRGRRKVQQWTGQELQTHVEIRCETEHLGSTYGGYDVCREHLGPDSLIYSAGIGEDVSFDLDAITRFGAQVYAFDPTPRTIDWLKTQNLPTNFHFYPEGLAGHDGVAAFTPPANPDYISHTLLDRPATEAILEVPVYTLQTLMQRLGHTHIDVLKMDIEGAEYDVIDHLLDAQLDIRQIVLEFHHRFPDIGIEPTRQAVARLHAAGYRIFDIGPRGEVYGFVRRSSHDVTLSEPGP